MLRQLPARQSKSLQPSTAWADVAANIESRAKAMPMNHELTLYLVDVIELLLPGLKWSTLARIALLFSMALLVGCTRRRSWLHGRARCLRVIHAKTRLTSC